VIRRQSGRVANGGERGGFRGGQTVYTENFKGRAEGVREELECNREREHGEELLTN